MCEVFISDKMHVKLAAGYTSFSTLFSTTVGEQMSRDVDPEYQGRRISFRLGLDCLQEFLKEKGNGNVSIRIYNIHRGKKYNSNRSEH